MGARCGTPLLAAPLPAPSPRLKGFEFGPKSCVHTKPRSSTSRTAFVKISEPSTISIVYLRDTNEGAGEGAGAGGGKKGNLNSMSNTIVFLKRCLGTIDSARVSVQERAERRWRKRKLQRIGRSRGSSKVWMNKHRALCKVYMHTGRETLSPSVAGIYTRLNCRKGKQ